MAAAKKDAASAGSVKVRAYCSPTLVLLAFDWPKGATRTDFLGFAVRRTPGFRAGEKDGYLLNKLSFSKPQAKSQALPSDLAPIQKFMWWDSAINSSQRGGTFTYRVIPVVGTGPTDLKLLEAEGANCKLTVPMFKDSDGIETYFNRAVVSSQAFSREFKDLSKKATLQSAMTWLANGLETAIPGFTKSASGLNGAIYHLTDNLWTVPALKVAKGSRSLVYMHKVHKHKPGTKNPSGDDTVSDTAANLLKKTGYTIKPRTKAAIMHDKFLVKFKNGKEDSLLMGSANFTPEGLTAQANLMHVFPSPPLAKLYNARQVALMSDPAMPSLAKIAGWSKAVKVGKTSVRAFFSPEASKKRVSIDTVVKAVNGAKSSVLFCMFSPTDGPLLKAMLAAGDKKKIMFGMLNSITDPTTANTKKNAKLVADGKEPKDLSANAKVQVELFHRSKKQRDVLAYDFFRPETAPTGFLPEFSSIDTSAFSTVPPVKPVPSSKAKKRGGPPAVHIHHKFIIIDADTASPTIFTGSANMSKNSVERNDENLLEITNSPTLGQLYLAEFFRLYDHYRARAIWNQTHTKTGKPKKSTKKGAKSAHADLVLKRTRDEWVRDAYKAGTLESRARVNLAK